MSVLDDTKKALLFKQLATKTAYEAGIEFGLDKHYKNASTVSAAVIRVYNQVKNNPDKYLVSPDTVELVSTAVSARGASMRAGQARTTLREKLDDAKSMSFEELTMSNRAKAAMLLSMRLDDALSSKKKREKVSLGEAAKVAGIMFDKGQLLEGKATDHVSLMGKIETDSLTPEGAIDMIIKMREYNNAMQDKKS
jgi:hypothetical protein